VAYIPVLHEGYFQFLSRHAGSDIYLLGPQITNRYRPLIKDLRALNPQLVKQALEFTTEDQTNVIVAAPLDLQRLSRNLAPIILPDEDISHLVADEYFSANDVSFDPVFLRWDRRRTEAPGTPPQAGRRITATGLQRELMSRAHAASRQSSDFWRQVGALIARDGQVLLSAYNQALPSAHTPWTFGDPRGNFQQGENFEASLFIHAEAAAIGEAARQGMALAGADMFINTFPCPVCAKLIAVSGIARCYFVQGYARLDAEQILAAAGVELIQLDLELEPGPRDATKPYPD
jgi:dCMP deaminase